MQVQSRGEFVVMTKGELKELIGDVIEEKLADFAQEMKEAPPNPEIWQKIYEFCAANHMSRSSLFRMVRDGKIEVMELSPKNKLYRWKNE